ncbi:MAG: hypothetical protein F4Z15_09430 [Gammaproteobacteria bacterium]|nr:hypothetical protein [Gammaproteobacteria bacterium]MYD75969.1 hypothetical protein [Gammaproteobacteria bacterium]MYJ52257.1 hypothetical protein [Gammaproteobacteria bacterium]
MIFDQGEAKSGENQFRGNRSALKIPERPSSRLHRSPRFDETFGMLRGTGSGCPGKLACLMVGLEYLGHMHGLSNQAGGALGGESLLAALLRGRVFPVQSVH